MPQLTAIEICAGGGGQALGLEEAGFAHLALVDNDPHACQTLIHNRPMWNVIEQNVENFSAYRWDGVDLLAAGVPCPPFSIAGKQQGALDDRDLFPHVIRLAAECRPKAIMIENVRGLLDPCFAAYRADVTCAVEKLGYTGHWRLLNASQFGVPQLRPRVVFVAMRHASSGHFVWPAPLATVAPTVGHVLYGIMAANGWAGAADWREKANAIAPTLVGGSKKHGGPDLGPTRARKAWAALGVDAIALANEPPAPDFVGMPRLTLEMTALLQGFPADWHFVGKKTPAYRQVGNAFPPPVARAVGNAIATALHAERACAESESVQ